MNKVNYLVKSLNKVNFFGKLHQWELEGLKIIVGGFLKW